MKEQIKTIVNGLKVIEKYGLESACKRAKNKQFHRLPDQETIRSAHLLSPEELERQRSCKFEKPVKFSIITPLYNTPKQYLIELLDSLLSQTYSNWELCLADGSDDNHQYVGDICKEYGLKDGRFVYEKLAENRGISENTNECIKLATGEFYGLLDHDDLLHPSALYEVMNVIDKEHADFIFSDEVKFSETIENISSPNAFNFKPGFGKYDLRSHNYICHFTVFSKSLLEGEKRLYRSEYDGSQDHDMVLRLTEKASHIVHIPKVLYYWRLHSNSVSLDLNSKSYAVDAAIRAVSAQLDREAEQGVVASNLPFQTIYRIKYEIKGNPLVSVIIHGSVDSYSLKNSIEKIINNTVYRPIQIVCPKYDNAKISAGPGVTIENVDINTAAPVSQQWNKIIDTAQGEFLILWDANCVPINQEWIEEMLMLAQKEDICVVGPKIIYRDQTIAYGGGALWRNEKNKLKLIGTHDTVADIGYEALLCHVRNTTFALCKCMMFSKKTWKELNGFSDDSFGYEDIVFCLKGLEKGKSNVWTCFANIMYTGKNIIPASLDNNAVLFEKKYDAHFNNEQFYHPQWEMMGLV